MRRLNPWPALAALLAALYLWQLNRPPVKVIIQPVTVPAQITVSWESVRVKQLEERMDRLELKALLAKGGLPEAK